MVARLTGIVALAWLALPALATAQPTALGSPQTLAGPLASLSLGGLAIARDGTGGLVYLTGGHVFASSLSGGSFAPPQQLDGGLAGTSSQPVIAAAGDGLLLLAYVNAGELYVSEQPSAGEAWRPPQPIYAGASAPALSISSFGKAYLAFAAAEGGGSDVRVVAFADGRWSGVSAPLNATPGDDAGAGAGRPSVVAAGDGVGLVAWGEAGHVYARRVWGLAPSPRLLPLDPSSLGGAGELSADSPSISAGGDSSYADVVFRESLSTSGGPQTRVLLTRLVAETVAGTFAVDGAPGQSADQPAIAMNEYGRGFATAFGGAATGAAGPLLATTLGTSGTVGATRQIAQSAPGVEPYAAPASAGLVSTAIAYEDAGPDGVPEVALQYAADGSTLGPAMTVSSSAQGPVQAADGLAAAGDVEGDAAVAWAQGTPGAESLQTAQLYVPPGQAAPRGGLVYSRRAQPTLSWSPAREAWGPLSYSVVLDGTPLPDTTATVQTVPAPLTDGLHVWQVEATNPAGEQSTSPHATVFVDTVAPQLRITLLGRAKARRPLTLRIVAADLAPSQPGASASGLKLVSVRWGDGTAAVRGRRLTRLRHAYSRRGVYRLVVAASDVAGNATTIVRYIRVLP